MIWRNGGKIAAAILAMGLAAVGCVPGHALEESESNVAAKAAHVDNAQTPPRPIGRPMNMVLPQYSGQLTQGGWIKGIAAPGTKSILVNGKPVAVAKDGHFFAAFDRDAKPEVTLVSQFLDGTSNTRAIPISPRGWKIEHVNIARRVGGATEAFMRIREPELARINAARTVTSAAQGWRQTFVWPAKGRVSGMFGSQRVYRGEPGSYHSGVDVAGATGTPFVAPADGVVILAAKEPFSLEGYLLMLDHGNGLNSAFLHNSKILVAEGDHVKQGQVIGHIGATGRATGPHLHWSMKWNDSRIDPILLTGPMP